MVGMRGLWLPVVLSAVIVFVVSSIIHMLPLWHRGDYPAVPDQDKVLDALRPFNLQPGDYMLPRAADTAEMKTDAFKAKMNRGPMIVMTVMPNGQNFLGSSLAYWFVYALVVSAFSAYVTGRALPAGASYLEVFRFAGATAFLSYSVALWQMSIWYKRAWTMTAKATVDGLIYACFTAGCFGWLWPR